MKAFNSLKSKIYDGNEVLNSYLSVFKISTDYLETYINNWLKKKEDTDKRKEFIFGRQKETFIELELRQKLLAFYYLNRESLKVLRFNEIKNVNLSILLGVLFGDSLSNIRLQLSNIETDIANLKKSTGNNKDKERPLIKDLAIVFNLFVRIKDLDLAKAILKDVPLEYWDDVDTSIWTCSERKVLKQNIWEGLKKEVLILLSEKNKFTEKHLSKFNKG